MVSVVVFANFANATETSFGPFSVDDSKPDVIALKGEIDVGAALNFRRALQATLITLNSVGGTVQMALLIADDVYQRKLSTYIAKAAAAILLALTSFLRERSARSMASLAFTRFPPTPMIWSTLS
jgi:hypothetical protein